MRENGRLGKHKAPSGRFTGKKRKSSKRKRKSSKAQRNARRGSHRSKYAPE